jgi:hypothetical protein
MFRWIKNNFLWIYGFRDLLPSQHLLADKVANIESREGSDNFQIWEWSRLSDF